VRFDKKNAIVLLEDIDSTGLRPDESSIDVKAAKVSFQFTTSEGLFFPPLKTKASLLDAITDAGAAARKFNDRLEEMRVELSIMSLKYPRPDERRILKL
jgi:hypothetical protein